MSLKMELLKMDVQHSKEHVQHEEVEFDISKRRFYARTPNVSLLVCIALTIGMCLYVWEVRLRYSDTVHAEQTQAAQYHKEITQKELDVLERIAQQLEKLNMQRQQ